MDAVTSQTLADLASYDFTDRNEAEVRGDWIDPLLRLLGYGLGTRNDILRERQYTLSPPIRMLGSTRLKVDYIPTVRRERLWIMEAKKPQEGDDLFGEEHLGQAWSYATDPRVDVSVMALCDGERFGIFDLTSSQWESPIIDESKSDIASWLDELFEQLGAPRIAERVRRRQLRHLKTALTAQVDLRPLDATLKDVEAMVRELRPTIQKRRDEIRDEVRAEQEAKGEAAVDKAGMWGFVGHANGPMYVNLRDIDRAIHLVERQAPQIRKREFDDFEKAATPKGQTHARMWFWLRIARMGCAVGLCEDEKFGDYFRSVAHEAAAENATALAHDPLLAAEYRLQRALGPLGWRIAANAKPAIDKAAKALEDRLEAEEWLRLDGQLGVTGYAEYKRVALLHPRAWFFGLKPWDVATLTRVGDEAHELLAKLPKPAGFEQLTPAGDPWQESWLTGDPLRSNSAAVLGVLASRDKGAPSELAAELLREHFA